MAKDFLYLLKIAQHGTDEEKEQLLQKLEKEKEKRRYEKKRE